MTDQHDGTGDVPLCYLVSDDGADTGKAGLRRLCVLRGQKQEEERKDATRRAPTPVGAPASPAPP
jgi:hypothetical protein